MVKLHSRDTIHVKKPFTLQVFFPSLWHTHKKMVHRKNGDNEAVSFRYIWATKSNQMEWHTTNTTKKTNYRLVWKRPKIRYWKWHRFYWFRLHSSGNNTSSWYFFLFVCFDMSFHFIKHFFVISSRARHKQRMRDKIIIIKNQPKTRWKAHTHKTTKQQSNKTKKFNCNNNKSAHIAWRVVQMLKSILNCSWFHRICGNAHSRCFDLTH